MAPAMVTAICEDTRAMKKVGELEGLEGNQ